ncbi:hypothetical protein FRC07_002130 [Ceratobasidium sp. 392]|nr:hypothetical protein FRC07_002130 [Ceratobasidium sp. 392]
MEDQTGQQIDVRQNEGDCEGSGWIDGNGVFGVPRAVEYEMDKDTEELGVVMDYATGKEVKQRTVFPGARVEFQAEERSFYFQKTLGDSDFLAAGMVKVPVGGRKPAVSSGDISYVFYCVSGAVEVKVHSNTSVVAPGGMFLVPRGNVYAISNVSQRDAYIFFAQSRKELDRAEEPSSLSHEAGPSDEGKQTEVNVVSVG